MLSGANVDCRAMHYLAYLWQCTPLASCQAAAMCARHKALPEPLDILSAIVTSQEGCSASICEHKPEARVAFRSTG